MSALTLCCNYLGSYFCWSCLENVHGQAGWSLVEGRHSHQLAQVNTAPRY